MTFIFHVFLMRGTDRTITMRKEKLKTPLYIKQRPFEPQFSVVCSQPDIPKFTLCLIFKTLPQVTEIYF